MRIVAGSDAALPRGREAFDESIEAALRRLTPQEQRLLRARFGKANTAELARLRGANEQRLEAHALRKLWVNSSRTTT